MDEQSRKDIRRLLKTFGIQADEAIMAQLASNPQVEKLHLRVTLEDLTDYDPDNLVTPLRLQVEDTIQHEQANN
ncbi:MAG: hypothetical protein WAM60_13505 [Candidatus Promineifilaceae bacterium]